jgi:hypothetical protein
MIGEGKRQRVKKYVFGRSQGIGWISSNLISIQFDNKLCHRQKRTFSQFMRYIISAKVMQDFYASFDDILSVILVAFLYMDSVLSTPSRFKSFNCCTESNDKLLNVHFS